VIAYELLTGELPFAGDSALSWAAHHISSTPVPIERKLRGRRVPAGVLATVMNALAKDPAERPQSAIDLARGFVGAPHPLWIEQRARRLR
jgi:serine/threonine-protein kinase